ncbi:ribonuclease P Rpr2/Rpp21/SNM1 subunit family protein [Picrophilus oshimae]|uniref:Ribonuclease P protein subunit RPR2 n=1 Tax=Picrophilus torridus (strain ATCC 700027 / DSM 9790 / JCM 10055 / NBRC 100828 / KAW 2/3) TaxID=1122961 RepID=A0A8G2FWV8_PICTO|nr:hypothetical protein [Picrophilus oshimae]SMD30918.1 ribonuclease P protein subunit RPR2 [Picrophilus oshimae DSM 9789]
MNIALKRINYLINISRVSDNPERCIDLMEKISKRMDITLNHDIKLQYCKVCKMPYRSPVIRLKNGFVLIHCDHCGNTRRIKIRDHSVSSSK